MFYHHKVNVPIVLGNLSLKLGRSIRLDPKTEWIVGDEEAAQMTALARARHDGVARDDAPAPCNPKTSRRPRHARA